VGAQLTVRDGEQITPGSTLAKIAREAYKTRDITGGLPRIAELFEARKPKEPAVITEVDGSVRFGDIKRGKREVIIIPETGNERIYEIPVGKHLRVHEGDLVRAGDRLSARVPSTRTTSCGSRGRARCRSTCSTRCRRSTACRA
jgi:DNA-directed RNA polymerase subunit beta'